MATSNLLEPLANVVAYAEKNLKMFLFLVFVTDYFVINNWPLFSNIWLSPFFLVSLTFIMIGLMALVYLLYQVMGESFVKADILLREGLVLVMAKMRRRGTLPRICPRRLQVLRASLCL